MKNKNKTDSVNSETKPALSSKVKKILIPVCCSILAGLIVGATGGIIYGRVKKPARVDFDDAWERAEQEAKEEASKNASLLEKFEQCKAEGKEPSELFTPAQLCNIGIQKFTALDNTLALGFGYAAAAGNVSVLDVRNAAIVNGDDYFEESISKSSSGVPIQVAERAYQSNASISVFEATFKNGANAEHPTWKDEISKHGPYTLSDYKKEYGKTVDTLGIYIVSDKTVIANGEKCGQTDKGVDLISKTNVKKDDNGYTVYMDMNTETSIPRYVKRMHALSNSNVAQFFYVNLEYRLDLELNLVYSYAHEEYAAQLGNISAKTTGRMITYYYSDQQYLIPDIKNNLNYDMKGEKLPEV